MDSISIPLNLKKTKIILIIYYTCKYKNGKKKQIRECEKVGGDHPVLPL